MNPTQLFVACAGLLYVGASVTAFWRGDINNGGLYIGYALANVFAYRIAG